MNNRISALLISALLLSACGQSEAPTASASLPVRYASLDLADFSTAAGLTARCKQEEGLSREHLATLEGFAGEPTVDNYYRSLDSLYSSIANVAQHGSSLSGVHPDEELRAAGEACEQLMAKISTDMGLSRSLYEAISKVDLTDADDSTRFSVEKQMLSFRLAGVDRSEEARDRIRALNNVANLSSAWLSAKRAQATKVD